MLVELFPLIASAMAVLCVLAFAGEESSESKEQSGRSQAGSFPQLPARRRRIDRRGHRSPGRKRRPLIALVRMVIGVAATNPARLRRR